MIPTANILTQEISDITYPNRTYRRVVSKSKAESGSPLAYSLPMSSETATDRINGYTDDLDAVAQAIYLILSTERYKFNIYSWDYGVELVDLFGKPMPYVIAELPRRITEALTQDNRIEDVVDFTFEQKGKQLHTTFTVVTNAGNVSTALEVTV